ncbi:MAG: hypothetical protein M5U34_34560 [Chloroflexi bacterium]|nr:hypothetical protein [Chloroflexota bacterium]
MSDSTENHSGKWVPIRKTQGELAAEVIASQLRAESIPTRVWQEGVGGALGIECGTVGNRFLDGSRRIRRRSPADYRSGGRADVSDEADDDGVECPHCGVLLELNDTELNQGWYICAECHQKANIVFEG